MNIEPISNAGAEHGQDVVTVTVATTSYLTLGFGPRFLGAGVMPVRVSIRAIQSGAPTGQPISSTFRRGERSE